MGARKRVEQPDETALIDEIVVSMGRVNRTIFGQRRHALRNAHAKSHGVLKGAWAGVPIAARVSNAPGGIHAGKVLSLKCLAIKIIGVDGAKVLSGKEEDLTQDCLLVNLPVLLFGDVRSYLNFQQKMEER